MTQPIQESVWFAIIAWSRPDGPITDVSIDSIIHTPYDSYESALWGLRHLAPSFWNDVTSDPQPDFRSMTESEIAERFTAMLGDYDESQHGKLYVVIQAAAIIHHRAEGWRYVKYHAEVEKARALEQWWARQNAHAPARAVRNAMRDSWVERAFDRVRPEAPPNRAEDGTGVDDGLAFLTSRGFATVVPPTPEAPPEQETYHKVVRFLFNSHELANRSGRYDAKPKKTLDEIADSAFHLGLNEEQIATIKKNRAVFIICEPAQFTAWLMWRMEAGFLNSFRSLKPTTFPEYIVLPGTTLDGGVTYATLRGSKS